MMKQLILFLVRRRLGLKKLEPFQFTNQKSSAIYYFGYNGIYKWWHKKLEKSHVSLNWLLSDNCHIVKYDPL